MYDREVEMAAHALVQERRERLADRDLVRRRRVRPSPGDEPGSLDSVAHRTVDRSGDSCLRERAWTLERVEADHRERLDVVDVAQGIQLGRRRRVTEGAEECHVPRPARGVEPRQRRITPARPGNGREHHGTHDADEQGERNNAAPTPPGVTPGQHPHRAHLNRPPPAPPRARAMPPPPDDKPPSPPAQPTVDAPERVTARWTGSPESGW